MRGETEKLRQKVSRKLENKIRESKDKQKALGKEFEEVSHDKELYQVASVKVKREQMDVLKRGSEYALYYLLNDTNVNALAKKYLGKDFHSAKEKFQRTMTLLKQKQASSSFSSMQGQIMGEAQMQAESERLRVADEKEATRLKNELEGYKRDLKGLYEEIKVLRKQAGLRYKRTGREETQIREINYYKIPELKEVIPKAEKDLANFIRDSAQRLANRKLAIAKSAMKSNANRVSTIANASDELSSLVSSCSENTVNQLEEAMNKTANDFTTKRKTLKRESDALQQKLSRVEIMDSAELTDLWREI